MRRILIGLTAGVLGVLGLAGTASAHPPRGHARAHYVDHGHRFKGGYYYTRYEHPQWERRVWDAGCHRWHYWDPCLHVWYYWCPQANCYYPTSYCP
jgi:hypothetical protein